VTFFVDTNVLVYAAGEGEYREPCLELLRAIAAGGAEGKTSTAVLEEAWHVELSGRAGTLSGLARRSYALFTPLLSVTDETVSLAFSLDGGALGANDRIHVATCVINGVDTIVTADAGFDGIRGLRRIDPLDRRALSDLAEQRSG
jgi:predicted nucleic acid-binding protein